VADDLKQTGKPDDARINVDQAHELGYWSEKLGVSREGAQGSAGSRANGKGRSKVPARENEHELRRSSLSEKKTPEFSERNKGQTPGRRRPSMNTLACASSEGCQDSSRHVE
jgi:hypothetical protein